MLGEIAVGMFDTPPSVSDWNVPMRQVSPTYFSVLDAQCTPFGAGGACFLLITGDLSRTVYMFFMIFSAVRMGTPIFMHSYANDDESSTSDMNFR